MYRNDSCNNAPLAECIDRNTSDLFTKSQMEVIRSTNGPLLVVACPGSGKTTTVVARVDQLLKENVRPENILVITFSKAAADEMGKRFYDNYHRSDVMFSTIHSFCWKVVKMTPGYQDKMLLNESGRFNVIAGILKARYHIDDQCMLHEITRRVISCMALVINSDDDFENREFQVYYVYKKIDIQAVYEQYSIYKAKNNYIDFDDMVIKCRDIFRNNPEILDRWQSVYHYVMIDEYQDTNIIQAEIFYMLASKYRNICVVGDDDQSIYSFRAADPRIMFSFNKVFPDAKVIMLDTNYRSDKMIVTLADRLINKNTYRYTKEFKTGSRDIRPCTIMCKDYGRKYGDMIAALMREMSRLHNQGVAYEQMAVLYRVNKQAQPIMNYLVSQGIPFHVKENSLKDIHEEFFFTCIEAYYSYIRYPTKEVFQIIAKSPYRYIPNDIIKKTDMTQQNMIDLCYDYYTDGNKWKAQKCEMSIRELFQIIRKLKQYTKPTDFVNCIYNLELFKDWAIKEAKKRNGEDYTPEMLSNSMDLIRHEAACYEDMDTWLKAAHRSMVAVNQSIKSRSGVALSTYHGAKGLEWDCVFLIDVNEGITPSPLANTIPELEEERRMFYVAFTRARKNVRLYVTGEPSQYLEEMGIGKNYRYADVNSK